MSGCERIPWGSTVGWTKTAILALGRSGQHFRCFGTFGVSEEFATTSRRQEVPLLAVGSSIIAALLKSYLVSTRGGPWFPRGWFGAVPLGIARSKMLRALVTRNGSEVTLISLQQHA